ncbi:glycosyltransferase family 2 protein [Lutibacter maritimus]|uniref:Glycosyltransferase, GT2 family n=1 Tax=Lutibacter maritimus TaxID=593133 RepID=A0A1I6P5M8_9FLAO|nr:glycosyltransferase [Lutibacter maritimus]SFS35388.1 Glycosyltransferase, GT2 family [Lutibacter maritimus]
MKFSLIICTYQRKEAIEQLLNSVTHQTLYPSEILVVDGSIDTETQTFIEASSYKNLHYFLVEATNRGLTKQRNFGISKVAIDSEIVCFLDDDTILTPTYFQELLKTYRIKPDALAVGGYIANEVKWSNAVIKNGYCIDGYCRKESVRFQLRKKLGLIDNTPPGFMPTYSHGRSIGHLPPSNKVYPVEFFMGGVASYKKEVVDKIQFSTYFEGYGLYEDLDFCLRVAKLGNLYVNTAAQLAHDHHEAGRPNKYKYGKMVVRNGWYVWRVKYPKPTLKAKLLFHLNVIVLLKLRFINSITGSHKKEAFTEALGRLVGWFSLFLNKPK